MEVRVHELVEDVDVVELRGGRRRRGRERLFSSLFSFVSLLPQPLVGLRRPEHVPDGDDVVVRAQGPQQSDLSEGAAGVGGVVERAGDLYFFFF